jgi:hypothetical protein
VNPAADVITTVQDMLTSATEVVSEVLDPLITSPPCDLCSLLSLIAGDPRAITGARGNNAWPLAAENASVFGPRSSPFARRLPTHGLEGLMLPGALVKPATLGDAVATGLTRAVSISAFAPSAPRSVMPATGQNILEHALGAVLVPASLSALVAVALPGVCGLLIVCAAGVRLGYRQAKAGLVLQATAMARFAGSGYWVLLAPARWSLCAREHCASLLQSQNHQRACLIKSRSARLRPDEMIFHIRADARTLSSWSA